MAGVRYFSYLFMLVLSFEYCQSTFIANILLENATTRGLLETYIPTIRAKNEICRNASLFYFEELNKYKLWAAENIPPPSPHIELELPDPTRGAPFIEEEQDTASKDIPPPSPHIELELPDPTRGAPFIEEEQDTASKVFDSSTKFPSGMLSGSGYDFGHFDECLELKIPYHNKNLYGKYCMAKFTVNPPLDGDVMDMKRTHNYEHEDYSSFYNISVWQKINDYLNDDSRTPRNIMRFAFCIPSYCSHEDLRQSLGESVKENFNKTIFGLNVEVDERDCQVYKGRTLENGDKIFIFVMVIAFINVFLATLYDLVTKRDDYGKYKFGGKLHGAILCFSFIKNFRHLTANNNNLHGLNCMAGMKVYSMFLIILLHRNMFDFGAAISNPKYIEQMYSNFGMTFLLNGPIVVDTFFTISGFLATYLTLHYYYKKKTGVNVLMMYFHRYIRMAPTYAVVLAFYCTLLAKMGNGPLWEEIVGYESEKCRNAWWANILFINNYINTENYCMFQSWYMACDMNAFIFVPIICLILCKKPSLGVAIIVACIIGTTIVVFATVYTYEELPIVLLYAKMFLQPNISSTFIRIYIPGHMRATPYFIGVLTGYLKYQMNIKNYKISKCWVRFGWILSALLLFLSLHVAFIFYVTKVPTFFSALYACLHHSGWSVAIAWMIVAISSGHGPWVDSILSWPPLVVLSRLTYSVYLCHGAIQLISIGILRDPQYGSDFNTLHATAADSILAYILAFFLTILFESPISGLEKVLLWGDKNRNSANKKDEMETATELPTAN